ncbi:unnamed protein product [Owenia fusiformis]|uniref:Protein rolling stone n=1 Tax=Owenia fusiformis TaxID=6347 RepID=A0A8S4NCH3_OWEFU|nr:unnamed protein product [Owenia fusiformis]
MMSCCCCLGPTCKEEFHWRTFGLAYNKPNHFHEAQWSWPKAFYVVHCLFWALWNTAFIIASGFWSTTWYTTEDNKIKWFVYLTNWAYFMITIHSIYKLCTVIHYSRTKSADGNSNMPVPLKIQWIISNISYTIALATTIAYWGVIYDGGVLHPISIMTHAINSVYVIADIIFGAQPIRVYHGIHPVLFGAIYAAFTVVYDVLGGTNAKDKPYVYSVLDWSASWSDSLIYYVIIGLVLIPISHLILYAIYRARLCVYLYITSDDEDSRKDNGLEKDGKEGMEIKNPVFTNDNGESYGTL